MARIIDDEVDTRRREHARAIERQEERRAAAEVERARLAAEVARAGKAADVELSAEFDDELWFLLSVPCVSWLRDVDHLESAILHTARWAPLPQRLMSGNVIAAAKYGHDRASDELRQPRGGRARGARPKDWMRPAIWVFASLLRRAGLDPRQHRGLLYALARFVNEANLGPELLEDELTGGTRARRVLVVLEAKRDRALGDLRGEFAHLVYTAARNYTSAPFKPHL